jgi:hypothetical protein
VVEVQSSVTRKVVQRQVAVSDPRFVRPVEFPKPRRNAAMGFLKAEDNPIDWRRCAILRFGASGPLPPSLLKARIRTFPFAPHLCTTTHGLPARLILLTTSYSSYSFELISTEINSHGSGDVVVRRREIPTPIAHEIKMRSFPTLKYCHICLEPG